MATLRVLRGPARGVRIALGKQDTVLGRGPDCDVPIPIHSVSRRHAAINGQDDQFVLRDLGSRNGTYLNRSQVRGLCPLRDGDHIRLADFETVFETSSSAGLASDWQASDDPQLMMTWLRQAPGVTRRKLWMLVAACRHWFGSPHERFGAELAERYAEGADQKQIRMVELGDYSDLGAAVAWEAVAEAVAVPLSGLPALGGRDPSRTGAGGELDPEPDAEPAALCDLLRCVFGNPFQAKPTIDPAWGRWNDGTVPSLARRIYDERRWVEMGVLHDALLDAGCDDEGMLSHAAERRAVHGRGCWVLDLLLNKE